MKPKYRWSLVINALQFGPPILSIVVSLSLLLSISLKDLTGHGTILLFCKLSSYDFPSSICSLLLTHFSNRPISKNYMDLFSSFKSLYEVIRRAMSITKIIFINDLFSCAMQAVLSYNNHFFRCVLGGSLIDITCLFSHKNSLWNSLLYSIFIVLYVWCKETTDVFKSFV